MSGLLHIHTLAVHMSLFLLAFPEQVCGTLCSENFSVRNHQHLLSPQSWIWVFSCSVSQENRADLPSSSSYFRSLTKCCKKYRQINTDLHSEQKTVWMVQKPINTYLKFTLRVSKLLTLPCTQDLYAEPSIFPSLPNYMSHSPVMGGSLPHLGSGSFHWSICIWSLNLKLSGLLVNWVW